VKRTGYPIPCEDCSEAVMEYASCIGCGTALCSDCATANLRIYNDCLGCQRCTEDWEILGVLPPHSIRRSNELSDRVGSGRGREDGPVRNANNTAGMPLGSVAAPAGRPVSPHSVSLHSHAVTVGRRSGRRRPRTQLQCAECGRTPAEGGWRCANCKSVTYCGTRCQARHWPYHRHYCHMAQ